MAKTIDEINDGDETLFAWDDSHFSNGLIEDDGTITIDDMEGI